MAGPMRSDGVREAPGLLEAVWRFRRMSTNLVVGFTVLGVIASLALSGLGDDDVVASAKLTLADPNGNGLFRQGNTSPQDIIRFTEERAAFARSPRVLDNAAKTVGRDDLKGVIDVKADLDAAALVISARAAGPDDAVAAANAVAEAYQQESLAETKSTEEQALNAIFAARDRTLSAISGPGIGQDPVAAAQRSAATQALTQLELRATEASISAAIFGDGVVSYEPALPPQQESSSAPLRSGAVGGLFGFLVALALAWVRADRYQTADQSDVPSDILEAPLLGEVPLLRRAERTKLDQIDAMPAEAFQFVAASLRSSLSSGVLLVTSTSRAEGRTVTAANLAAAAAKDGRRVVLIDADGKGGGLIKMAGLGAHDKGLSDLATGVERPDRVVKTFPLSNWSPLSIVPAGNTVDDVSSMYRTTGMADALRSLREQYDLVIIDCPPLLGMSETASLAGHADGVLVVVKRGTSVRLLETMRQRLDLFPTRVLGFVFNQ